ncbi:proline-rich transmembrane protein 1 [Lingula anatina]|uniref:Proline-rich transmembrane protein 1 n=1 Tax=Lingula anatina TaxID=7574 RepID=A0A1S3IGM8_LINAN|nr:proline-rich transmembrane protein 1 [Lingula anatina]|eukprot:XP_013397293.1 proline-rich transmembrane protein 1 [Lingula anatina]
MSNNPDTTANQYDKAKEVPQGQGYPQGGPPAYGQEGAYPPQAQYYPQGQPYGQPITGQPQTVMVVHTPMINPPPDHMIYAIVVTIFCCWPIGIFAIMKALACRDAINRGDITEAQAKSAEARRMSHWALGVGIGFIVLIILFLVIFYAAVLPSLFHSYNEYD